jgi:hypothetical protein
MPPASLAVRWLSTLSSVSLLAYCDRDYVAAATSGKLTIGGDQDDAITLALANNMTAAELDVSEIAVTRHRCHSAHSSHTLSIFL